MKINNTPHVPYEKLVSTNNKVEYRPSPVQEVLGKAVKLEIKDLSEQERLILRIHLQRVLLEKILRKLI